MTTATGVYKGFETKNGFITAIIEGTGLESQPGKTTKWFNAGKIAPKTASGSQVSFEYTSKDHENGNTYYTIKGTLKEVGMPPAAQSGNTPAPMNSTNSSIESQVAVKEAGETLRTLVQYGGLQGVSADNAGSLIAKIATPLIALMAGGSKPVAAAPKPKPKPIEDQSQDPDDDIPY